ncbi:hypothetical protein POPTR_007G140600v4 [Populus trichocarpa]|uniref:Uncharacterized protein n=1 Tax=Populus trichocarpa TaxID=3694 RepID=A0ACC0SR65_POPTR|nr:hypothetical protein POPTR_007G140600v4 [Populus trichocarpa]
MENMVNTSHVLVVPLPGAGHVNPMLQFSRRLVSKGLKVTFIITKFISKSRQLGSSIGSIQLDTISDGYDDGFNQAGSREPYLSSLHDVGPKTLSELIKRYQTSSSPIHAVIYEPFLAWALDVAKDFGLFAAAFFTCLCQLLQPVLIEGLPLLLELQDLPTFVVLPDSYPANVKMTMSQFANLDKADWILINTFYKLECEVVDTMSKVCPLLTIGPTIPSIYLDKSIEDEDDYGISLCEIDASLSINWLRTKPTTSVVYMSFGSCATLSSKQMEEIAWGLKRSNFHFWFVEEVENKGLAVNWSPQVKVLANEAVGCFFTHCSWNSTIEVLSLGVPMVTMPGWSDQQTNSKIVEDAWKVGVRAKVDEHGIVKREEIAICIKEVMEGDRGKEMKMNSKKWKDDGDIEPETL